ncbi:LuxR family transcriptional regulator, partial [bacterium]
MLKEIALGKSSIEIAEELHISPTTVDTHRRNVR